MMARLPTHLMISAAIRAAMREGVNVTVVRKGDAERGAILLKLNRLDGTVQLYEQVWQDDVPVWNARVPPGPENIAEERIAQSLKFDPDLWVVEVEDRLGRLWLPGKVVG